MFGMKQRLAIAQTIMENQTILILDEPMNGLDKKGVSQMREIFLEYKKKGNSILMATHNPQDVEILCDHVSEMMTARAFISYRMSWTISSVRWNFGRSKTV